MLKDNTEKISGVFFEEIIDQIKEGACYDLSKMRVQKYQEERVLKSTENSEAVENGALDLIKNDDDDNDASINETKMVAKVVTIDLKTLGQTYQCAECNAPVTIQAALAWCQACDNVSSQSVCKAKAFVNASIVSDTDHSRYHIKIAHSLIEKKFDIIISNVPKKDIIPKLINKTFMFTIDTTNKCVEFADC